MVIMPIENVRADHDPRSYAVRKMEKVLREQGQIEPLQVRWSTDIGAFITFPDDPWGAETFVAARNLGWETIGIVEMRRYEA